MQNLFALDVMPQEDVVMAGECFVQRKVPTELGTEFLQLEEEERALRRAAAPPMHMIIAWVAWFALATCFFIFSALQGEEEPASDAVVRLWPLIAVGGVFLLVGIAEIVHLMVRIKRVRGSSQMAFYREHRIKLQHRTDEALGVPEDAKEIEAIVSVGKSRKPNKAPSSGTLERMMAFVRDGKLFLACDYGLYAVPLVGIVATVLRKKEISLSEEWWAEKKTYTSPPRKGHVRRGRYGYGLRSHYAVQICTAKGEFELIVAPWSIGALAAVADLKPVAA